MPIRPGEILAGKYRVTRILGQGGMGVVVAATHIELHHPRAIKLMRPEALGNAAAVRRFEREARAAAQLTSDHAATVYDVGRLEDGAPFMVMEHLKGRDLGAELDRNGALTPGEAAFLIIQACEALAEAHALGIIHRDLKPSNLFLTRAHDGSPRVKVLDFGISKVTGLAAASAEGGITTTDAMLGSPIYMAPEQVRHSRSVDARADIWSLGVILYELVTGVRPFEGATLGETLARVLETAPPPPSQHAPDLPADLDAIVLRCLEKDRDKRFADVKELAKALVPLAPTDAQTIALRVERNLASAPPAIETMLPIDPLATTEDRQSGILESSTVTASASAESPVVKKRTLGTLAVGVGMGAIILALVLLGLARPSGRGGPGSKEAAASVSAPDQRTPSVADGTAGAPTNTNMNTNTTTITTPTTPSSAVASSSPSAAPTSMSTSREELPGSSSPRKQLPPPSATRPPPIRPPTTSAPAHPSREYEPDY